MLDAIDSEEPVTVANFKIPDGFEVVGVVVPQQADLLFEKRFPICDLVIMQMLDDDQMLEGIANTKK